MAGVAVLSAVAIGTTAYSVDAAAKARKQAQDQANDLQNKQDALISQQQSKLQQDQAIKAQAATSAAARQDAIAGNTTPAVSQDVINSAPVQGPTKTLLGA